MDDRIKTLPKAELHCHLDGSISLDTIRKLADMEGISIPRDERKLKSLTMAPDSCTSLKEYLNCFSLAVSCMQTRDTLRLAAYYLIKEAAEENLIYIEVRFAPFLHLQKGLTLHQVVESVLNGMEEGCREFGVEYGLILCAMRNDTVKNAGRVLELVEEYREKKVVAMDLAGNEADYPVTLFEAVFREAVRLRIPFTVHAGEAAGAESVKNAVALGAVRIGHGIAACRDKGFLTECKNRGVTFEFCPSSNMQTKAADGWEDYPFLEFYQSGLLLTVNTDNRRVTGTSLTKEFELLRAHYGIREKDVKKLVRNAFLASFREDKEKLFGKLLE